MKTSLCFVACLPVWLSGWTYAAPSGTAFTYQGRLTESGQPANGSYDLIFTLWDAGTAGVTIAGPATNSAVMVSNGLFTVSVDFGVQVFDGEARWLAIGARTTGGGAGFALLNPRQAITPSPYALYARSAEGAGTAALASATASNSVTGPSIQNGTITTEKIAAGQVIKSLNGLKDDVTLAAGTNATVFASGQTLTVASPMDWHVGGNTGTVPGTHFMGTVDNQPLELRVNNARALRVEPNSGAANLIGGHPSNSVAAGVYGAVIGGGGHAALPNRVESRYATVAGGIANIIQADAPNATIGGGSGNSIQTNAAFSTIPGGMYNTIQTNAGYSTIGGGFGNTIQTNASSATIAGGSNNTIGTNAPFATIVGGGFNEIRGNAGWSTISGGGWNTNTGFYATVLGGRNNLATNYSLAAGRGAQALHTGAFVWADSTDTDFASSGANQFSVRANGGVRFVTGGAGLTIDGASPLSGPVQAGQLGSGSVVSSNLAPGAVTSAAIADGTITPADINAGSFSNTFWKLNGNAGTLPGTHFLGTTDNQPLEFRVNGLPALRIEPSPQGGPNLVGGSPHNFVRAGVVGATISGGGATNYLSGIAYTNSVLSDFGVVSGGMENTIGTNSSASAIGGGWANRIADNSARATIAGGYMSAIGTNASGSAIGGGFGNLVADSSLVATIAGGWDNEIRRSSAYSSIGGGTYNTIGSNTWYATIAGGQTSSIGTNSYYSTIGGGAGNKVFDNSWYGTIAGGHLNTFGTNSGSSAIGGGYDNHILSNAWYATIPGGRGNVATNFGFAAGFQAKAIHQGAFVWADSTGMEFASSANNQFAVRASGGVQFVTGGGGLRIDGETALSGLVEPGQLAAGAVTSSNLAVGAVTSAGIADGTITPADVNVSSFSNTFWKTDGNVGTAPGTHFLGTTDNRPLDLRANAERAFRLEPGMNWAPNVIGGSTSNTADAGVIGATIAGGGTYGTTFSQFPIPGPIPPFPPTLHPNRVAGNFGTVGGGAHNSVGPATVASTVGGGYDNTVADSSSAATISGGANNWVLTNATGAAIGGGRDNILFNGSGYSRVGGGRQNWVYPGAQYDVIAGGATNTIEDNAVLNNISGGWLNTVQSGAQASTIGGGGWNKIGTNTTIGTIGGGTLNRLGQASVGSTIGGGAEHLIADNARYGTIPGGLNNSVAGNYGFAAGHRARAWHTGSFVWADSAETDFASTGTNQFLVRASGGVGINTCNPQEALHVAGKFLRVDGLGNEQAYLGGDGWGGQDVQLGSLNPAVTSVTLWNTAAATLMDLNARHLSVAEGLALSGANSFLDTTGNQSIEFKVNGMRALRLEDNGDSNGDRDGDPNGAPNLIGGAPHNFVGAGVVGATIAGGGATNQNGQDFPNGIMADYSSVGGGIDNRIETNSFQSTIAGGAGNTIGPYGYNSCIGGGIGNTIQVYGSTIAGGYSNTIEDGTNASLSTIGGGLGNRILANGVLTTIGGGLMNTNSGRCATIPGGEYNTATDYAFAAGRRAKANHTGSLVWADSTDADFASTSSNQFCIRASGGVGIGGAPEDALLDVEGDLRLNEHDLFLRAGSDRHHGLGWYGLGKPFAGNYVDGPVAYGWDGGALGTANPEAIALYWNRQGQVGIGTSTPGATLDVAGSVRLGTGGTTLSRVQAGTIAVGSGTAGVNVRTNTFPVAFSSVPKVVVSARGGDYNDTFVVSTRAVTTNGFKVNILRLDQSMPWAQNLQVDWIAWE